MAIKSQKFLPSAELRESKKTISTSLLRDLKPEKPIEMGKVSKEDSLGEKFGVIFQFLKKEYKRDRMSWFRERRRKQEERRKKREEELEKNKGKSKIGKGLMGKLPFKNIFDTVGNFLLFLAGGFLFNKIVDFLPQLMEIGKIIKPIIVGIYNFGKFMTESVIGFIDAGYAIHDSLRQQVEDLGGEDAVEKFDKFTSLFKKVINGAIILALISTLRPRGPKGGKPCPPCPCPCQDKVRQPFRVPVSLPVTVTPGVPVTSPQGEGGFNLGNVLDSLDKKIENFLKNLIPFGKPTNERISGQVGDNVDEPIPVTPNVAPEYSWVDDLNPQQVFEILKANLNNPVTLGILALGGLSLASLLIPFDGQTGAFLGGAATLKALKTAIISGSILIPATILQGVNASELQSNNTPTLKMEVVGRKITDWRDLEDEPLYTKSTIIFKTTKIQPIIQEKYTPLLKHA